MLVTRQTCLINSRVIHKVVNIVCTPAGQSSAFEWDIGGSKPQNLLTDPQWRTATVSHSWGM